MSRTTPSTPARPALRQVDMAMLARDWPLPAYGRDADKEARGRVLIIAGSREIPGAALLAATAALRAGAGKLALACPESIAAGLALAMPEARVIALPETKTGTLKRQGADRLADDAARSAAVLIGPGWQCGDCGRGFTEALLGTLKDADGVPAILDAEAMDAATRQRYFDQPVLLTPHAGEMAHLSGQPKAQIQADAPGAAAALAALCGAIVALKGADTFIASPEGDIWQHSSANPGMATSGSGDVLAGLIVGLAARGLPLMHAAAWGVALHAQAGEALAERQGPLGFLARDLAAEVPGLMRKAVQA